MTPKALRQTVGTRLRRALLDLAAALGAICIVLALLAHLFGVHLMMFKTGSMSPSITAGSVAVAYTVPASEVEPGDVVTVDRVGALPVTHRIVSVEPGTTTETRSLTLRGDANEHPDPLPYEVSSVRLVLFSVPGIAPVLQGMSHPLVLGGLTVACAALVGWALWPERGLPRGRRRATQAASR
ncbi:MAG: S26 family signal peptidase [Salinibacterium sp.]|nr:S26 family signal peptidase [Salinibacterium sp.]MBF0673283.1 S26 family signal peptidase [Salinibacterium sp.]